MSLPLNSLVAGSLFLRARILPFLSLLMIVSGIVPGIRYSGLGNFYAFFGIILFDNIEGIQ